MRETQRREDARRQDQPMCIDDCLTETEYNLLRRFARAHLARGRLDGQPIETLDKASRAGFELDVDCVVSEFRRILAEWR